MNKKIILLAFSFTFLFITSLFSQNQSLVDVARELEVAKELYSDKMNELEKISSERWKVRQKAVLEKEQNREILEQNRMSVEQLYGEIARVREEKLAREELLVAENSKLKDAENNWKALVSVVDQKRKQADDQSGGLFPVGFEQRMANVSAAQNRFPGERFPAESFREIIKTQADQLKDSRNISSEKTTIVDDRNNPIDVNILRIGHAYAIARADSASYYLSFFGEGVSVPFKWQKMSDPITARNAASAISSFGTDSWTEIPVDMMQNDQSKTLIDGEIIPLNERISTFLKKGGFIMVPLILVAIWAIFIVLNRIIIFAIYHRRDYTFINEAVRLLESGKISEAKTFSESGKGVLARVLNSCLKHTDQSRKSAEQSVKEMLLGELPSLDKHLDTLAVIAGSAPLLGLLGTVTGMINMFEAITRFGTGDPKLLAGGISEALITTEVGLAIAIPVLLVHNWLRNRRNGIQSEMEIYAMRILNRIWPSE